MKYISTRGNAPILDFEEVAITGLASDGGLYVPEEIPTFTADEIASWKGLSYADLAFNVMKPFVGGAIPEGDFKSIIDASYKKFRTPAIAPLKRISDNEYILELFHGPTLAFKDFALQFLGNLMDYILEKRGEDVVVIGATSGDTGSAAIEGCIACKHVTMFMLHPLGRVSDVQRRQMTTILSDNIHNIAVETHFDGCQEMVKEMFANPDFIDDKRLTAVNSINWARIMAQVVYYFYAALQLGAPEKALTFSVPTGNFGDILAGYIAEKMGLSVKKLIVATNKNDILHRFFKHNDYSKTGVSPTLSPSMDIQISSNFERLLFELHNHDGEKIASLMEKFRSDGTLSVDDEILEKARELFDSSSLNDDGIRFVIKELYEESNYVVDPHTATGIAAARVCTDEDEDVVILSTAHPAKFPDVAKDVLGLTPELPEHLSGLMEKDEHYTSLPNDIEAIKSFISEVS